MLCLAVVASVFRPPDSGENPPGGVISDSPASLEDFSCPRCNVIFLNIELLRADQTGLIGKTDLTPTIDAFFDDGIIFHDITAPAGETFLSNTAVQTGVHPERLRIIGLDIDRLAKMKTDRRDVIKEILTRERSWAEILKDQGYHTIGINQGGRAGSGAFLDRGFDDYTQLSSDVLFEDVVQLLEEKLQSAPDAPLYVLVRPTFLHNWNYRTPHVSNLLKRRSVKINPYSYETPWGENRDAFHLKRHFRASPEEQVSAERLIYARQLAYGDKLLSRVFEQFDNAFLEKSIIVLYANHGSGLGDNGTFDHGTVWQASVHVPVFIKHPKLSQQIAVFTPLALFDLVPSISAMIGVAGADWSSIEHFQDTISRGGLPGERPIIGRSAFQKFIRIGRWKLVARPGNRKELFDVTVDPHETNDISRHNMGRLIHLESLMNAFRADLIDRYGPPVRP